MPGKRKRSYSGSFARKRSRTAKKPSIYKVGKGVVVVKHREYLRDLFAYNAFTVDDILLNPGLEQSFPWLSQIAAAYEIYDFTKLKFTVKPTFSDVTTTGSGGMGSITMATQYNVQEKKFTTKRDMENREGAVSGKPSVRLSHYVRVNNRKLVFPRLFVRTDENTSGDDRLYDIGRFAFAISGMDLGVPNNPGVVAIGELWVDYTVTLSKPRYNNVIYTDVFYCENVVDAAPLGIGNHNEGNQNNSTLGGTINATGLRYLFPPHIKRGKYLLTYTVVGTNNATTFAIGTTTGTNCTELTPFINNTSKEGGTISGQVSCPKTVIERLIEITGENASWGWAAGVTPTLPTNPITSAELLVTEFAEVIKTI